VFLEGCCELEEIPPAPIVAGGMVYGVWGQKGKKMGGGRGMEQTASRSLYICEDADASMAAAHLFPPSSPDNAHHSAANAVSERNLQQKDMNINQGYHNKRLEKLELNQTCRRQLIQT
jgi:hypothetical protein